MYNLEEIIEFIMHNSINKYKMKNSKASDKVIEIWNNTRHDKWKTNKVAVVNHKDDLKAGIGHVVASEEVLVENAEKYTHWTPNPYKYLGYKRTNSGQKTKEIEYRTKNNVNQVNTLVVDIDEDMTINELNQILIKAYIYEEVPGFPSLYVKTPRGWHLYYVLDTPFYNKSGSRTALLTAEAIHRSLVHALNKSGLPVDKNCLFTGFFRMPNNENVRHFNNEYVSSEEMKKWSIKYSNNHNLSMLKVVTNSIKANYELTPEWVEFLMNEANIRSLGHGVGRNSTVFTLALYFKSTNASIEEATKELTDLNNRLSIKLSDRELNKTIESAYNGQYNAPSKKHVEDLLEAFESNGIEYSFGCSNHPFGWYKFAKKREDRTYSHYSERMNDLEKYLLENTDKDNVFVSGTVKEIIEKVDMPRSSFYDALKQSNHNIIKITDGRGKNAVTYIALKTVYKERLLNMLLNTVKENREQREAYSDILHTLLSVSETYKETCTGLKELSNEVSEDISKIYQYLIDKGKRKIEYENTA